MANGKELGNPQDEELARLRGNFTHGITQVMLFKQFLRENGGNPFSMTINRNEQPETVVIDERFIMAMNAGTERMYRELCSLGDKSEADEIMSLARTEFEETP